MASKVVRHRRLLGVGLLLTTLLFACQRNDAPKPAGAAEGKSEAPTNSTPDRQDDLSKRIALPPPSTKGPVNFARVKETDRRKQLLEKYRCATSACGTDVLGASNPDEAAWLESRGFPTSQEQAELEHMGLGELQLAADHGDMKAQSVLGRRLMENGDQVGGLARLTEAASQGSVYADYQLSSGYRNSNSIDSAAYLRRAYLQGDTKAAALMYQTFPDFSRLEWKMVDERAMQLYGNLLGQRARRGRMQYGPRP